MENCLIGIPNTEDSTGEKIEEIFMQHTDSRMVTLISYSRLLPAREIDIYRGSF